MGRAHRGCRLSLLAAVLVAAAACTTGPPPVGPLTAAGGESAATPVTSTSAGHTVGSVPSARVRPTGARTVASNAVASNASAVPMSTAPALGDATASPTRSTAVTGTIASGAGDATGSPSPRRGSVPARSGSAVSPTAPRPAGSRSSGPPSSRNAAAPSSSRASIPGPPRLTTEPADYTSPETVAAQYIAVWCYMPLDKPANQNIANAASWMDAAGFDDDKSRAIGPGTWEELRADQTSTVCGRPRVARNTEAPNTARRQYVQITVTRYRVQRGRVISQDVIAVQRIVLRADDGRWLVDRQDLAG